MLTDALNRLIKQRANLRGELESHKVEQIEQFDAQMRNKFPIEKSQRIQQSMTSKPVERKGPIDRLGKSRRLRL